jgi:hypothetical protein
MYTNMDAIPSTIPAPESLASPSLPLSNTFAWLLAICTAALISAPLIIGWTAGILLN